jgi:hypothetical protein
MNEVRAKLCNAAFSKHQARELLFTGSIIGKV